MVDIRNEQTLQLIWHIDIITQSYATSDPASRPVRSFALHLAGSESADLCSVPMSRCPDVPIPSIVRKAWILIGKP